MPSPHRRGNRSPGRRPWTSARIDPDALDRLRRIAADEGVSVAALLDAISMITRDEARQIVARWKERLDTTPRKPRLRRLCACGCGKHVPLTRRCQARYVNAAHKNRHQVREHRRRRAAAREKPPDSPSEKQKPAGTLPESAGAAFLEAEPDPESRIQPWHRVV